MSSKGFTIIELVVTVGIFALLAGLAVPFGISWFRTDHHRAALRLIDTTLHETQARAMASDGNQDWDVRITANTLYVYAASGHSSTPTATIPIPSASTLSGALPIDIVFAAVSGESHDASFQLRTDTISTTFHVYATGAISLE